MDHIPTQNYARALVEDRRRPPPLQGDERAILTAFLDWQRGTFELKCDGVPTGRLSDRGIPPSDLSLHGLIRHLAGVERWWFRRQFAGEDVSMLYYSDEDPNQDFEDLDGDTAQSLAAWRAECAASREIITGASSLDQTGVRERDGQPFSLRWLLVKAGGWWPPRQMPATLPGFSLWSQRPSNGGGAWTRQSPQPE